MPQITVEYSDTLSDAFDRAGFARALHPVSAGIIDTPVAAHKTRFRRLDEFVAGDGAPGTAVVHIEFALFAGRTTETKDALGRAVIDLLRSHVKPVEGLTLRTSMETRDMDRDHYYKGE